jgi:hypothetical protein
MVLSSTGGGTQWTTLLQPCGALPVALQQLKTSAVHVELSHWTAQKRFCHPCGSAPMETLTGGHSCFFSDFQVSFALAFSNINTFAELALWQSLHTICLPSSPCHYSTLHGRISSNECWTGPEGSKATYNACPTLHGGVSSNQCCPEGSKAMNACPTLHCRVCSNKCWPEDV